MSLSHTVWHYLVKFVELNWSRYSRDWLWFVLAFEPTLATRQPPVASRCLTECFECDFHLSSIECIGSLCLQSLLFSFIAQLNEIQRDSKIYCDDIANEIMRLNSYLVIIYIVIFYNRCFFSLPAAMCHFWNNVAQLFESIIIIIFSLSLHLLDVVSLQTVSRSWGDVEMLSGKMNRIKRQTKDSRQPYRRFIAQHLCWDLIKVNKMSISASFIQVIVEFHLLLLAHCGLSMSLLVKHICEQRGSEHSNRIWVSAYCLYWPTGDQFIINTNY